MAKWRNESGNNNEMKRKSMKIINENQ